MPIYIWKGRTRQGTIKKGEVEAVNEAAVMAQLRAQMLLPVSVKEKSRDVSEFLTFLKPRIKIKDLVIFTRQFATMIDAGLPLVQCLDILGSQQSNATFRVIIKEIKADVEQGSTFADALRKHPKPFDALYTNLVAAGEVGGILDTILNRLAVYLEKADALRRKVQGRDGVSDDRAGGRGRRRGPDAGQDHSDLRAHVQGLRRRAARADAGGGEHEPLHAGLDRALHWR